MIPPRRIKQKVRNGELSPYEALDIAVTSRVRSRQPLLALERWAEVRIQKVRAKGGNPLLRMRGL